MTQSHAMPGLYLGLLLPTILALTFVIFRWRTKQPLAPGAAWSAVGKISLILASFFLMVGAALYVYVLPFVAGCREGSGDGLDGSGNYIGAHGSANDFLCAIAYVMFVPIVLGLFSLCACCALQPKRGTARAANRSAAAGAPGQGPRAGEPRSQGDGCAEASASAAAEGRGDANVGGANSATQPEEKRNMCTPLPVSDDWFPVASGTLTATAS